MKEFSIKKEKYELFYCSFLYLYDTHRTLGGSQPNYECCGKQHETFKLFLKNIN